MKVVELDLAPAPVFSADFNTGVALATIYMGHYDRMRAVIDAARSGNSLLINLSLQHLDEHGSGP